MVSPENILLYLPKKQEEQVRTLFNSLAERGFTRQNQTQDASQIDWGWEKTTIKLNKKETQATGAARGAGAIAALPWMAALGASGPVGLAILAAAGKLGYDAIRAHRNGKCLGIVVSTNVLSHNGGISTFEYRCA